MSVQQPLPFDSPCPEALEPFQATDLAREWIKRAHELCEDFRRSKAEAIEAMLATGKITTGDRIKEPKP